MPGRLQIHTLGGLTITCGDQPVNGFASRKVPALLVYLAVTGRSHPRELLAEFFWEERDQSQSLANLRVALTSLRQTVGDYVNISREVVGMAGEADWWLDTAEFKRLLAAGDRASLADVVALYQGDFLSGFYVDSAGFEDWVSLEREHLRLGVTNALDCLVSAALADGDYATGITQATHLLCLDPLREETHRALMLLLAQAGQRHKALAQYETCVRLLENELGVSPLPTTTALYEQIRAGEVAAMPQRVKVTEGVSGPRPSTQHRHNLPVQSTSFIGREAEISGVIKRLRDPACRLLTLVGAGGMGKTRLALAVAERLLADFRHGVFFASLAPLDSSAALVPAMASAVGFQFYTGDTPRSQLSNYLRQKDLLLVLDNFEHLLDGVDLLDELLTAAPGLTLLVTSREVLNLDWEWLFEVRGLAVPQQAGSADANGDSAALRLFAERARRVQPDFSLAACRESVVSICQRVGGMPLGIELAAAWLRTLPCQDIAAEIARSLDLLETEAHNIPTRHRSIRALFVPTWQRLGNTERDVLMRLAVFRGGFTQEAAQDVADASLRTLLSLVNKSLLAHDTGQYRFHALLHRYAQEQLDEHPALAQASRDHHCAYFTDFMQRQVPRLEGSEHFVALDDIDAVFEDVLAAWDWAIDHDRLDDLGKAWLALREFCLDGYRFEAGEAAFRKAVALFESDNPTGPRGLMLGRLLCAQGALSEGIPGSPRDMNRSMLERGLSILRQLDARYDTAFPLYGLAGFAQAAGEYDRALQLAEASHAIYREAGNKYREIQSLWLVGLTVGLYMGNRVAGKHVIQEMLSIARANDFLHWIFMGLLWSAALCDPVAEQIQQRQYNLEALAIVRQMGGWGSEFSILNNMGWNAYHAGDFVEAERLLQESLAIASTEGLPTLGPLMNLGQTANAQGNYPAARRYFGEAAAQYWVDWWLSAELEFVLGVAELLAAEGKPEWAVELFSLGLSHPASPTDIRPRAEAVCADIEVSLGADAYSAAWARGQELDLKTVMAELVAEFGH